jgi:hypothetical protein
MCRSWFFALVHIKRWNKRWSSGSGGSLLTLGQLPRQASMPLLMVAYFRSRQLCCKSWSIDISLRAHGPSLSFSLTFSFSYSFFSPCSLHPSWRLFSFSSIPFSFFFTACEAESDTSYPASAREISAKINVNHASPASDQESRSRARTSRYSICPDVSQGRW